MYTSTEQIINDFDLKVSLKEELRKELKKKLKDCHPDKDGGEFKTTKQKEYFEKISSAINFLDTPLELSLRQDVGELAKIVKDIVKTNNEENYILKKEEIFTSKIEINVKNYASTHLFPKISSSIIAGILSFLWLFPKSISEHEILSEYFDIKSTSFTIFWFFCIIMTAYIWLIFSALELKDKKRKNNLKLESVQNELFNKFLTSLIRHIENESETIEFTKEEFMNFIAGIDKHKNNTVADSLNLILGSPKIDIGLAQDLSEIILKRMQAKEIVKIKEQKSISDIFIVELDDNLKNYYR